MNGVIYCRVSSREQIEGTSLELQEAACRDYAHAKGIRIVRTFIEQGESAKFADRTQLVELIDFCRDGRNSVTVLLVWKVDRFARNVADHFSVKATLGKYGVRILSVTEPIDSNPEGKLMETILAGFAQFDNDIRAVRTVQGMRRKLQEGIYPWHPPLGYQSSVSSREKKTRPDLPSEPAFSLLKEAWKRFASGSYTQSEIGRLLMSWGAESPNGKGFYPQMLHKIFTNPYYAGVLVDPWSNETFKGSHIPMVTPEEFEQVQRVMRRRNCSAAHQKDHPAFPMRGIARCDCCFRYFTGAFSHGRTKTYAYYICHASACSKRGKSIPVKSVDQQYDLLLKRIMPRPQAFADLEQKLATQAVARESQLRESARRHAEQRQQLDSELAELIRMRSRHLVTDQEFLDQKAAIVGRRAVAPLDGLDDNRLSAAIQNLRRITLPLTTLPQTRARLTPALRKRFDRIVVPAGFVHTQSRTADIGLLFSIVAGLSRQDSTAVALDSLHLNQLAQEIRQCRDVLEGIEEEKRAPRPGSSVNRRKVRPLLKSNPEPDHPALDGTIIENPGPLEKAA